MARPRSVDDDALLDATVRAVGRVGPARVTLADVAAEAGLAPATLVQRFGSKRGLLLAVSQRGAASGGRGLRRARAAHRSPLAALRAGLVADAGTVDDPDTFANNLAFLQLELSDPDFLEPVRAYSTGVLDEIRSLVQAAVEADELGACDTSRLAATLQTTYNGALLTWAIFRRGSLQQWVGDALDAVLEPYASARDDPAAR